MNRRQNVRTQAQNFVCIERIEGNEYIQKYENMVVKSTKQLMLILRELYKKGFASPINFVYMFFYGNFFDYDYNLGFPLLEYFYIEINRYLQINQKRRGER